MRTIIHRWEPKRQGRETKQTELVTAKKVVDALWSKQNWTSRVNIIYERASTLKILKKYKETNQTTSLIISRIPSNSYPSYGNWVVETTMNDLLPNTDIQRTAWRLGLFYSQRAQRVEFSTYYEKYVKSTIDGHALIVFIRDWSGSEWISSREPLIAVKVTLTGDETFAI